MNENKAFEAFQFLIGLYTEEKMNAAYAAIAKKDKAENDFGDTKTNEDWGEAVATADDDDTWD